MDFSSNNIGVANGKKKHANHSRQPVIVKCTAFYNSRAAVDSAVELI